MISILKTCSQWEIPAINVGMISSTENSWNCVPFIVRFCRMIVFHCNWSSQTAALDREGDGDTNPCCVLVSFVLVIFIVYWAFYPNMAGMAREHFSNWKLVFRGILFITIIDQQILYKNIIRIYSVYLKESQDVLFQTCNPKLWIELLWVKWRMIIIMKQIIHWKTVIKCWARHPTNL